MYFKIGASEHYLCALDRKVEIFSDDENEKPSESPKQMDDSASDDESTKSGPTSPAPQNDSDKENSASDDDDDDDVKGMEFHYFRRRFFVAFDDFLF